MHFSRTKNQKRYLLIEIDFAHVNSLTRLRKQVQDKISWGHNLRIKLGLKKDKINKTDYPLILEVADKHFKEGWTYEKIAEWKFPNEYDISPEAAKQRVTRFIVRYRELVDDGDYKKLISP